MAQTLELVAASATTSLMSTELNSLANAGTALGSTVLDNSTGLYLFLNAQLNVTFGSAPTAGNTVDLYLVPSLDGTNYSDTATTPNQLYAGSFPLRAVTTAQKVIMLPAGVMLGPFKYKPFIVNNSGVAFPASGSTLDVYRYNQQAV